MSDVNILISVQNTASKEIDKVKKDLGSLEAKTETTAKNTTRTEAEAARNINQSYKLRQEAIRATIGSLTALSGSLKFLYTGRIAGGLIGSVGLLEGLNFAHIAAQSDQIKISFQNTFGNKSGSILDSVRTSVKGIVDDTTLMQEAIKTNMAGIRDIRLIPEIFKLGAVASQRLGISAEEGLDRARKAVVEFNEGAMENLGILNKLDPNYKIHLAVIEKTTKGLGAYLSTQYKLNYVLEEARKRYGANFQVLETGLQAFQFLGAAVTNVKNNIGYLVEDALAPLARGFAFALTEVIKFIEQIRNDKVFRDGALAVIRFSTAILGMVTALTATKLAMMGLMSIFGGPFGLIGGLLTMAVASKAVGIGTGDIVDKLKLMGQMAIGIFQLVSSFFSMGNGLAQINEELAKTIGPNGMKTVIAISQAIVSTIKFIQGLGEGIIAVFTPIFHILQKIGFLSATHFDMWKDIGKVIGIVGTSIVLLLLPISLVISAASRLLSVFKVIQGTMEAITLLQTSGILASVGGAAGFAGSAGLVGAAGAAGYFGAKALGGSTFDKGQIGEWLYDKTHSSGVQPTATAQSSMSSSSLPKSTSSNQVSSQSSNTDKTVGIMAQAVHHLQNIDQKISHKSPFEEKLMGTSR